MENWQKIEIIVTTVAAFYELRWQRIWIKYSPEHVEKRALLIRLAIEHLHPRGYEDLNFSRQVKDRLLKKFPEDEVYEIISSLISSQLTIKRAS